MRNEYDQNHFESLCIEGLEYFLQLVNYRIGDRRVNEMPSRIAKMQENYIDSLSNFVLESHIDNLEFAPFKRNGRPTIMTLRRDVGEGSIVFEHSVKGLALFAKTIEMFKDIKNNCNFETSYVTLSSKEYVPISSVKVLKIV